MDTKQRKRWEKKTALFVDERQTRRDIVKKCDNEFKAGVNMKAVFWLDITALTQISRLRFKQ